MENVNFDFIKVCVKIKRMSSLGGKGIRDKFKIYFFIGSSPIVNILN